MLFLGIDPGIERTGFGIVQKDRGKTQLVAYGVITTSADDPLPQRLEHLHTDLHELLVQYPAIACVGVEELFFAKNVKTAMVVSQARGVILFTLQQFHCTIKEIKPVEVKSLVTGDGRADKTSVQRMIQLIFDLQEIPQPDDAADAIAIAVAIAAQYFE